MAHSRRRPGRLSAALVGLMSAGLVATACGSDDDAATTTTGAAVPASDLAPSQVSVATVAPPTLPDGCDPADIVDRVVESDGGVGPDQVIELVNAGDRECDVDISTSPRAADEIEPSVRLEPDGVGLLWVEGVGGCDETLADPPALVDVDVNGERRSVDLVFVSPCGVELTAFFTD